MSDALDRVSRQTAPTAAEEDSDRGDGILFFPVRHHSPAAARLAAEVVRELRPDAVLIEGPSDFNQRIDELALDHSPPIAVYSWVVTGDGERRGAYYPFCVYSPEWQALRAGFETGAEVAFIDLPWAELAAERDATLHRYADAELKRSRYVDVLCRNLEGLGQLRKPQQAVDGLRLLLEAHERCGVELDLDREGLVDVLARVVDPEGRKRNTGDGGQQPAVRGAPSAPFGPWGPPAASGSRTSSAFSPARTSSATSSPASSPWRVRRSSAAGSWWRGSTTWCWASTTASSSTPCPPCAWPSAASPRARSTS